jgi:hypothetical protein
MNLESESIAIITITTSNKSASISNENIILYFDAVAAMCKHHFFYK